MFDHCTDSTLDQIELRNSLVAPVICCEYSCTEISTSIEHDSNVLVLISDQGVVEPQFDVHYLDESL